MRPSLRLALVLGGVLAASTLLAPSAEAQWRPRSHVRVFVGAHVGYPYYSPYYSPFFSRGFYGWSPYYWGAYPQWGRPRIDRDAVVIRTDVSPKDAQVYVDGYFRGSARDFDDRFSRLVVEPGQHEIVLFMEGYRTTRRTVDLRGGTVYSLREKLVRLSEGQKSDPPPVPPARAEAEPGEAERAEPLPGRPAPDQRRRPIARPPDDEPIERERPEIQRPEVERPGAQRSGVAARGFGSVAIRVQPVGAEVVIDGERWEGIEGRPLVVQLSEGRHRVEVRLDGYETFVTEVRVREGETVPLNVSLPRR